MKLLRLAKPAPLPAQATEAFTRGYVHALREEVKKAREKALEASERAQALEVVRENDKLEADACVIRAVLRALATQARMIDLDALQLADLSSVTVDGAGEVQGAAELIQALRQEKPFLFEGASTSSPHKPPPPSIR